MIPLCEPGDLAHAVLVNPAKQVAGHTRVKNAGTTRKDVDEEPTMHPRKLDGFIN